MYIRYHIMTSTVANKYKPTSVVISQEANSYIGQMSGPETVSSVATFGAVLGQLKLCRSVRKSGLSSTNDRECLMKDYHRAPTHYSTTR